MRFLKFIILMVMIFVLGSNCVRIDEVKDAQRLVQQTMSKFYTAQEVKDVEMISSLYLKDSTIVALGFNGYDQLIGWKQIRDNWQRYFATMEKTKVWRGNEKIRLNFDGNVAWVSSVNQMEITRAGSVKMQRSFFSAVLQKSGGRWLFVQTHISQPGNSGLAAMKQGRVAKDNVQPVEEVENVKRSINSEKDSALNKKETNPTLNSANIEQKSSSPEGKDNRSVAAKLDSTMAAKPDTSQKK